MKTDLKDILLQEEVEVDETIYCNSREDIFSYPIITGRMDFYSMAEAEDGRKKVSFKNSVDIYDSREIQKEIPALEQMDILQDTIPYFTTNLANIIKAKEEGRPVAIEGGPCLFGENEVAVQIILEDDSLHSFDYCSGKNYGPARQQEEDLEDFLGKYGKNIRDINFLSKKTALTVQEYDSLRYLFQAAHALQAPAVITIPDMSYMKYLEAIIVDIPEDKKEETMTRFREVCWSIADIYLQWIDRLKDQYEDVKYLLVHDRNRETCRQFFEKRRPYIERNKVLRTITSLPQRLESVKDYVSMPALPFYLLGITDILEINSVDETDPFRKCAKAHKGLINFSCILYPEQLSKDGEHTIYQAKQEYKEYLSYD